MLTRLGTRLKPITNRASQLWLSAAGLTGFTIAGFHINTTVGWTIAGAACLVLEWRADAHG